MPVRIRVAAIIVENEQLLLVRHEKEGESYWMLPGGGVDEGETLGLALCRELREELCIDAEIQELVLVNDSIAPDGHRHIVNLYFTARRLSGMPTVGEDPRIVEAAFHPVEVLHRLRMYPDFAVQLQEEIRQNFPNRARYLGNLWR